MPVFSENLGRLSISHSAALKDALSKLLRHPFATLLSTLTIAIALAIPGLFLNVQQSLHSSDDLLSKSLNLNIFMKLETEHSKIEALADRLTANAVVASVNVISSDEALQLFSEAMKMDSVNLDSTGSPLPAVIEVSPRPGLNSTLQSLIESLEDDPIVDQVLLDQQWAKKLNTLSRLISLITAVLSILFAGLLFMVMANTMRLEIVRRQEEIEIIKLVGGTDGYIILPFMYYAVLLALAGSVIALAIIMLASNVITPLLSDLLPPTVTSTAHTANSVWLIPLIALFLGCTSAWFAVNSGLRRINSNH